MFAPCAMGAVINDETIPQLKAVVVVGAANNQLEEDRHGEELARRGIVYLPDYVANGGGLISCSAEWYRRDKSVVPDQVRGIYDTCRSILQTAQAHDITTSAAANRIAEQRFREPDREEVGNG